jgi:serine/threonine protein kinase
VGGNVGELGESQASIKLLDQVDMEKITLEDFEFGQKLGSGSFGQVFKTKFKLDNNSYALKMLDKKFIEKVILYST